mmetsp:Transcript_3537/g.5390  ORF Transcript_3537/g.5390 Transcript_3537/m.5390 type:complete len:114 (+) Transcript_3537:512-853(+)
MRRKLCARPRCFCIMISGEKNADMSCPIPIEKPTDGKYNNRSPKIVPTGRKTCEAGTNDNTEKASTNKVLRARLIRQKIVNSKRLAYKRITKKKFGYNASNENLSICGMHGYP